MIEAVLHRALLTSDLDPIRKAFFQRMLRSIEADAPLNGSHFFWDHLIGHMGCPFLKRELLQKNPAKIPFVSCWERVIRQSSDYDTDLILRHLEVVLKHRCV